MKYYLLLFPLLFGMSYKYSDIDKNIFKGGRILLPEKKGCCYDIGFSNLMIPIYNNHNMTYKSDCKINRRMGGSTEFSKLNCSDLKLLQIKMPYKKDF